MTASASSRAGLAGVLAVVLFGCAGGAVVPWQSPMEELPRFGPYMPDSGDLVLHDAAAASLVSDPEGLDAAEAAARALDAERYDAGEPPSGLLPHVLEARNATLPDAPSRRRAAAAMLRRDDLPPEMRARMEMEVRDDPLRLARSRISDARRERFARIFNGLVEPVGRSASNLAMLPMRAAQAVVNVAIREYKAPKVSTAERQALDHWKEFIERNPESSEALALLPRVEKTQRRWYRMMRDQTLGKARKALRAGRPALALSRARRALRYAPEDEDVLELMEEAQRLAEHERRERERSLRVDPAAADEDAALRGLAIALLLPGADLETAARRLEDLEADGERRDEIEFVRALALSESGREAEMWQALEEVEDDDRSNMARHARQLRVDPDTNPYGAYKRARASMRNDRLRWLLLGPLAKGPRSLDLPRPVEWLVSLPSLPKIAYGLPNRLLRFPFMKSQRRSAGVFARRYLERVPSGGYAGEVRDWLADYEEGRGNFVGALRVAQGGEQADPEELSELRERAARQAYDAAMQERRFDARVGMLRDVAKKFQGTEHATRAGKQVRREVEEVTPQQIRISRGFLDENPRLVGPEGLALRPEVLDGDEDNGELHPDGVRILSGEWLEFAYVPENGSERGEPEWRRTRVSKERMARLVALLEDSAIRNSLLDQDFRLQPDADRDLFFERARLGVAGTPHPSATARSTFAFEGMRETYGLVRARESILPVEIVLQGSLQDFGLGAFPRIRMPKETPDAFLYR